MSILVESKKKVNTENEKIYSTDNIVPHCKDNNHHLGAKTHIQWICTSKDSPFTFQTNRIYSLLAKYHCSTKTDISDLSGLALSKTVIPALATLKDLGLVDYLDGAWQALEPNAEQTKWFTARKGKSGIWHNQLQYHPHFYTTDPDLTIYDESVLWSIFATRNAARVYRIEWYATALKMSTNGVKNSVRKLRAKGYAHPERLEIVDFPESLLIQKQVYGDGLEDFMFQCWEKYHKTSFFKDGIDVLVATAGINEALKRSKWHLNKSFIGKYWQGVWGLFDTKLALEAFIHQFPRLFAYVQERGNSPGYLVASTKILATVIQAALQHNQSMFTKGVWTFNDELMYLKPSNQSY